MDIVEDYRYLGVFIDRKLDWAKNTDALYKKGNKLICKASDAVGVELDCLTAVSDRRMPYWTMSPTLSMTCWSNSARLRSQKCTTERRRKSILPVRTVH